MSGQSKPHAFLWGPLRPLAATLIALLGGDDVPDAAAGFLDIALVAGSEVDVGMGHGLACCKYPFFLTGLTS